MAEQKKTEVQAPSAPATAADLISRLPSVADNLNPITLEPFELMELLDDVHGICAGLTGENGPLYVDLDHIMGKALPFDVRGGAIARDSLNARDFLLTNYGIMRGAISMAGIIAGHAARYVEDAACHIDECESTLQHYK